MIEKYVLTGILAHSLSEKSLRLVAAKHKNIGKVPNHYFYPELLAMDTMPDDLAKALANKNRLGRLQK